MLADIERPDIVGETIGVLQKVSVPYNAPLRAIITAFPPEICQKSQAPRDVPSAPSR